MHNAICVSFNTHGVSKHNPQPSKPPMVKLWDNTKIDSFLNTIDNNEVDQIYTRLCEFETTESFDQNILNEIVTNIANFF